MRFAFVMDVFILSSACQWFGLPAVWADSGQRALSVHKVKSRRSKRQGDPLLQN